MSTPPDPPPPPPTPPEEPESKVAGVVAGIFTPIGAGAAAILGANVNPTVSLLAFLLVMLGGILLWRKLPGFGLGIAWFFGVAVVTFTACTILVISALG